jgi:transcriptional regulator with XRE-family HTH domain
MVVAISPDQSRQARRELGLSQAGVEAGIGLKRQYLSEFESGTSQRFTRSQLRKLVEFYSAKIEEARSAGDEIDITFDDDEPAQPVPTLDVAKVKRFHFPVDDAVPDDVVDSVLASIRTNDRKLADLLTQEAARNDGFFGSGNFTEETLQALRDSLSLLACNYLMVRAVTGWPEIGLSASSDSITGNTVLSAILGSVQERFQAAGLLRGEQSPENTDATGEEGKR